MKINNFLNTKQPHARNIAVDSKCNSESPVSWKIEKWIRQITFHSILWTTKFALLNFIISEARRLFILGTLKAGSETLNLNN